MRTPTLHDKHDQAHYLASVIEQAIAILRNDLYARRVENALRVLEDACTLANGDQDGIAAMRRELGSLRRDKQALRALAKEAFCEGMMSAEGAPKPLNSDMESAWKHSETRELLESF